MNNEQFITPVRGLYPDHVITVEEFKDRNAGLMKNRWIDTTHGMRGEKIYEMFDAETEGELVKESMQEWLCDNRHQITECIGIALRNHELSYAEWFKFVDEKTGPDELALYSLSQKYGIHTSVFNKSYVWTTLMKHITRTDEEIYKLSGVNLVYLGRTVYGIIRDIRAPHADVTVIAPKTIKKTTGIASKHTGKTTCRDSSCGRGRKSSNITRKQIEHRTSSQVGKPQMLSESRKANYGIVPSNTTIRKMRSSRQPIDYVSLNDGYEDKDTPPTKKQRKESHRPRSAPSATRISANKRLNSPKPVTIEGILLTDALTGVPGMSKAASTILTGVADNTLPDLVTNRSSVPEIDNEPPTATNTLEDLEAANTLLSLGDTLEDTVEDEDDNALLMPIGGMNIPEDIAPQPLRLDQISVDNVIAGIVETEQLEKETDEVAENKKTNTMAKTPTVPDTTKKTLEQDKTEKIKKGLLKTKTYVLKKPEVKRMFKCSECDIIKLTIQQLNEHHRSTHNPQMCGICSRTFALASSLTRHMYDHDVKRYNCDSCNFSSHFKSELESHKILHRKTPSHQCMQANCGKWFMRKWDLTLHLQTHEGKRLKCNYKGCKVMAATKKQLKEHQRGHTDDFPYECDICHKNFRYRSGRMRHRDKDRK